MSMNGLLLAAESRAESCIRQGNQPCVEASIDLGGGVLVAGAEPGFDRRE
jgi:hypothetical protein